jgi:hypothetical protein
MKINITSYIKFALISLMLTTLSGIGICQSALPEVLTTGTLNDQMNYIEQRTRIYENYRAIREDMFQKIKSNSMDSLSTAQMKINSLQDNTSVLNLRIDSLAFVLNHTDIQLNNITATKNSIAILGVEINKTTYNAITWALIAGLLFLLAAGFLAFKRNIVVSINIKKELEELKKEYETYRQNTRIAREKMSMDHFNELKRLKEQ